MVHRAEAVQQSQCHKLLSASPQSHSTATNTMSALTSRVMFHVKQNTATNNQIQKQTARNTKNNCSSSCEKACKNQP